MIASLMMYARPELEEAHLRLWDGIRAGLASRNVASPERLSQEAPEFEVWCAPDLVLSQTCGMPYRSWLADRVTLIGTPDYGLEGCPPGYYRSAIVVRQDDPRDRLEAFATAGFAFNQVFSQSGYAAIHAHAAPLGFWFTDRRPSGGHATSARMVAEGAADIASLDAVTWRLLQRYEGWSSDLRVLEWTTPTPGLPLISAKAAPQSAIFDAVSAAITNLSAQDREALSLRGLVALPKEAYLAVANPPDTPTAIPAE